MTYIRKSNLISRFLRGGVKPYQIEEQCIIELVNNVPDPIKISLFLQFEKLNLIQREIDGRALNFYPIIWGKVSFKNILAIPTKHQETKLLAIEANPTGKEILHINYWLVDGIFFQMTFSKNIAKYKNLNSLNVTKVVKSWLSDINI